MQATKLDERKFPPEYTLARNLVFVGMPLFLVRATTLNKFFPDLSVQAKNHSSFAYYFILHAAFLAVMFPVLLYFISRLDNRWHQIRYGNLAGSLTGLLLIGVPIFHTIAMFVPGKMADSWFGIVDAGIALAFFFAIEKTVPNEKERKVRDAAEELRRAKENRKRAKAKTP